MRAHPTQEAVAARAIAERELAEMFEARATAERERAEADAAKEVALLRCAWRFLQHLLETIGFFQSNFLKMLQLSPNAPVCKRVPRPVCGCMPRW